ncbi:MAG: MBG domain-containing protein, partial [Bacillota bacterium]|nr:MBG domain-containing protein [Bacillota bacterium]
GSSDNEFTYTLNENTKAANYDITTAFGTLTVTKSEKVILITAGSDSKIYDGSPLTNDEYTYTEGILAEGDVLTATVEGSITDAGTAENRITGYCVMRGDEDVTGNYTFAEPVDGTLVVSKRPVVLTSDSGSKIYDATPLTANTVIVSTGENQGFVSGEGADYTVTGSQTNVGESSNTFTYQLKAGTKADNYQITTAEGQLKVDPATLIVKADNKTKTFGQENPQLTGTITGFVNGEKESDVLKGKPQYETTAKTDSPAGDYPITASVGSLESVNGNYVFQFADGTLTVTAPPAPSDDPDKPSIFDGPKTGDGFSPWLIGGLALAALLAAAVTFLARRRFQK